MSANTKPALPMAPDSEKAALGAVLIDESHLPTLLARVEWKICISAQTEKFYGRLLA